MLGCVQRIALAKEVEGKAFPSKTFHDRLAALDDKSFKMGNLKNVPVSKGVINQCKHEAKKKSRVDDSIIVKHAGA